MLGHRENDHNTVKSEPNFKKFTEKFFGKFVATLRCETLMSAKQAISDKLQGSVASLYI